MWLGADGHAGSLQNPLYHWLSCAMSAITQLRYSAPPERMSSVCFQASPTKVFLTLFLFYIPE
jgi:hypothetical protein